jgi:hypothetical protein
MEDTVAYKTVVSETCNTRSVHVLNSKFEEKKLLMKRFLVTLSRSANGRHVLEIYVLILFKT